MVALLPRNKPPPLLLTLLEKVLPRKLQRRVHGFATTAYEESLFESVRVLVEDEGGEIFGGSGGEGASEDVAYAAHLLHGSGEDLGVAVADTDDRSATTGVNYGARGVGEVDLEARGMGDMGRGEGEGAMEESTVGLSRIGSNCLIVYRNIRG